MATERQIQQTMARCVDAMGRYYEGPRNRHATVLMTAEVQAIAAWVEELGLGAPEADDRVIRPVRNELFCRHGEELGARLFIEFLVAFDGFKPIKQAIEAGGVIPNPPPFDTAPDAGQAPCLEPVEGLFP